MSAPEVVSEPNDRWTTEQIDEFVTPAEEVELVDFVRDLPYVPRWHRGREIKSRRQYDFGAGYEPSGRLTAAEPIPQELGWLHARVEDYCGARFDQLIVNWYPRGGGITPHTDHPQRFGEPIAGLSLRSHCLLVGTLEKAGEQSDRVSQVVAPRSLYVLRGDARWHWKHSVTGVRSNRWSLTYRVLA